MPRKKIGKTKPIRAPDPVSMQDFINTLKPVRKPGTCSNYSACLRYFHRWLTAQDIALGDLDRCIIERWLRDLADRRLQTCTHRTNILNVRAYLRWLYDRDSICVRPDELIRSSDIPKMPFFLPRPFPLEADRELQHRFLEGGSLLENALFVMRRSGVRIGELVCLEPSCLSEDIHRNVFLKVPLGKLDNERLVPLDDRTQMIIRTLQRSCSQRSPFLIRPAISRKKIQAQLRDALRSTADGIEIPGKIVPHRLRHTYATELLNAGMSLHHIMKLLGHRSIHMTMRYAAITQETIVKDFHAAMARISTKYELPAHHDTNQHPEPERMLRDVISYLRKVDDPSAQRLIKRTHKLLSEISRISTDQ